MPDKLLKNTIIYALGDIIPKVLSFLVFPVLTSHLSLSDYGIVNYVNSVIFLLSTIGLLCLNTYYLVFYHRVEDKEEQRKLLGNLSIFVIGLNFLLSLFCFGAGVLFPKLFGSKVVFFPYIAVGIVINFFNILAILPSAFFRVQERPLPLTIINTLRGVLTTGIVVLLVVKYHFTALGVLYTTLIVSVLFGLFFLGITIRNMTWNIDYKQIKNALTFSLPLLPGALAYYFLTMADRLFIERYLDLTQLGTYTTASTLAMILNILAYGAYKAFEPYFFKIYKTPEFKGRFISVQNIYILAILFGAMGLSIFAKEFFAIFASESYHKVYYYVPMVEAGVVFSSITMLYGTIIIAQEKTKLNTVITIIGCGLSVLLNILLLPHLGIVAACLASGSALGLILMLSAYFTKLEISFIRPVLAIIMAAIAIYISVYILKIDNMWFNITVKISIFFGATIAAMLILGLNFFLDYFFHTWQHIQKRET
jgi:O-antigen/teichoic acid export membrane protein